MYVASGWKSRTVVVVIRRSNRRSIVLFGPRRTCAWDKYAYLNNIFAFRLFGG